MLRTKQLLYLLLFLIPLSAVQLCAQTKPAPASDSSNTIPDTLLFKIQSAQSAINEIDAANKNNSNVSRIAKDFAALKGDLLPVKTELEGKSKTIDKKSLLSYELILKDAQEKLLKWQTGLTESTAELQKWSKQVVSLSNDSLLNVSPSDTTGKELYNSQIAALGFKLERTGKTTNTQLDTVSRLLAEVAEHYALVTDLQNNTQDRLNRTGMTEVGKESPYIWSAPSTDADNTLGDLLQSTYRGQNQILGYFIRSTWDNRILLILLGLGFFWWIRTNFKKARTPASRQLLGDLKYDHLRSLPFFATILLILALTPLFEPDAPSLYIELIQFLALCCLSFYFWRTQEKATLRLWFTAVILHVVIVSASALINDALWIRLLLMFINSFSIYYGISVYKKLKEASFVSRFVKSVTFIYIGFNVLAILLNVFGRTTLARVFSITAIIGLTELICLVVFVQICMEALDLQMKVSSCSNGIFSRVNLTKAKASFKKFFSWLSMLLWWIVFMVNLGISSAVISLVTNVLSKQRVFGSLKFSLGNLLFFALLIYVTNLMQKYVALLFGDSKLKFEDKVEHKSSKLALIRLIIILLGVLMAFAASGVPMDKLTVVLGAFGVGIGLGMQNIINNFVSGIILIFERPFRIGDYIELADKKGKVQDIGIRSSRMLTAQGSDVIIPNGDLLSGRLVNWTLENDYIKSEITFKVGIQEDLDSIQKMVEEELAKLSSSTVGKLKPEFLINAIAADSIELKVLVWINNIYIESGFKSELFKLLLARFKEKEVKLI
jgi:potassium efflux system protein